MSNPDAPQYDDPRAGLPSAYYREQPYHDQSYGDQPYDVPTRPEPQVDPLDRIDELTALVEGARAVPMSSNCMVHRGELLGLLDDLRVSLPTEIRRSQALLDERDKVIGAGRREADRIVAEGEAEHARLVSAAEVTVSAEHEAAKVLAEARAEAQRMRDEVREFVDTTLANFERTLHRVLDAVERGRDRMNTLSEIGSFEPTQDDRPLPF